MRVSIAVHGRFHAFDLAAALLRRGADVRVLTNYPRYVAARWLPAERVGCLRRHAVLERIARTLAGGEPPEFAERALKQMFGRWAARQHIATAPDVVHCWSGVAEESLRSRGDRTVATVARGSAHIKTQYELLAAEQARTGRHIEKPSAWIVAREQREYALADRIIVPSAFARDSFLAEGVPAEKVVAISLSLRATGFSAPPEAIEERVQRLRAGAPLRVLYAGTLSFRKGMYDVPPVLQALAGQMEFRFVGPVMKECAELVGAIAGLARVDRAVPHAQLPEIYRWGDVFLLPTIEDGFAVVLAQAQAAGLPIIATTNSAGRDIIAGGGQGFVIPIRNPEAIIERLRWCDEHRAELARMVERLYAEPAARNWDDVADDFLRAVSA